MVTGPRPDAGLAHRCARALSVLAVVAALLLAAGCDLDAARASTGGRDRGVCKLRGTLSTRQITAVARRAGFRGRNLRVAVGVAVAESSGRTGAVGDGGQSIGLWQIHMPSHPRYPRRRLMKPCANARAAKRIATRGRGWRNWTTYRTGAYRRYTP